MRRLMLRIAMLALAAWAIGLVVAATRLAAWDDDLVRTLLQIRADAAFRINMAQRHEPISREWYRSKALALLKASEKVQDDSLWAVFVPGAWRRFDDLRERVAARIEREFSEIAVETVRRELYWRTSQLTGVPQDDATGELVAAECRLPGPLPVASDSAPSAHAAPLELPEYLAVREHLRAVAQLDEAVQAMVALQEPRDAAAADPDRLRLLVHYTLGAQLPGRLTRSAALFSGGAKPWDAAQTAVGLARLQQAVRCSLAQAMRALDKRVFERDDLLASEVTLREREARLAAQAGKQAAFDDTVRAVHEVITAIDAQQALLAQGDYGWLYRNTPSLGPTHDALLAQVAQVRLLGPDTVLQLRRQSGGAMARFRSDFEAIFRPAAEPALAWQQETGRLALSPQRLAWRAGLVALLQQPFMVPPADAMLPADVSAPLAWDPRELEQALVLADARRHFMSDALPKFPHSRRAAIARLVDGQVARLVQARVAQALVVEGPAAAPELAGYGTQRAQLARIEALLISLGARPVAERIQALVSHDLVDRLALAEQDLWRSALFAPRTGSFDWWQGERAPQWAALGAADAAGLKLALAQVAAAIDAQARGMAALLAHTDSVTAPSPTVLRWQGIVAELRRYRSGSADSSLLALERYLLELGPDFSASNCAGRLAGATPHGAHNDVIAQRHLHIHQALAERCAQLRGGRWG
jgi:type VI secretion system protein ImpL